MNDIVFTENDKVFLNSFLTEESFAKTKLSNLMDCEGLLVSKKNSEFFSCQIWKFTLTEFKNGSVFFTKEGFSGCTLDSYISLKSENLSEILFDVVSAVNFARKNGFSVPCNAPKGILYNKNAVLFLPEKLFSNCARLSDKTEYEKSSNIWVDSASSGKKAELFFQSVLVYYSFTKKVPFPFEENENQAVNIADKKFIPLDLCVNGISRTLSDFVSASLKNESDENALLPLEIYKTELFNPEQRKNVLPQEEFQKKLQKFIKTQNRKVGARRILRRNYISMIISFVVFCFVLFSLLFVKFESDKKPSVKGLDSETVTEIFFEGIHKMNADFMTVSGKNCPQAKYYISTIPQIRAVSMMSGAYNFESGLSSPENWMFFEPDTTKAYSHQIYGISCFTINGRPSTLNVKIPSKKDAKTRLLRENGRKINNLDEVSHNVKYYLVHTVNNTLQVDLYQTEVFLTFEDGVWQVIELKENFSTEFYDWAQFSFDYKEKLSEYSGDVIKAVSSLREKYPWVPTSVSLKEEEKYLDSLGY